MATWADVEKDRDYQSLSPDGKRKFAGQFFDSVITKDRDYTSLSPDAQKQFRAQFMSQFGEKQDQAQPDAEQYQEEPEPDRSEDYIAPGTTRFKATMSPLIHGTADVLSINPLTVPVGLAMQKFSQVFDDRMAEVQKKEAEQYSGLSSQEAQAKANRDSGLLSDALNAVSGSTLGKMLYSVNDPDLMKKVENTMPYQYQPKHQLASTLLGLAADLPLYEAGTMIGGPFGTFAFPAGLRAIYEAKISGQLPSNINLTEDDAKKLANVTKDAGIETGIGMIEGLALHGVNLLTGRVLQDLGLFRAYKSLKIKDLSFRAFREMFRNEFQPSKIVDAAAKVLTQAGVMTGASVLHGEAPSLESFKKNVMLIGLLSALHVPFAGKRMKIDFDTRLKAAEQMAKDLGVEKSDILRAMRDPEKTKVLQQIYSDRMNAENRETIINKAKESLPGSPGGTVAPSESPSLPEAKYEETPILPKEERGAPELEDAVVEVYPKGWRRDKSMDQIIKRAYTSSKYVTQREAMDRVISEIWPEVKADHELLADVAKDKTYLYSMIDPVKTGYDKLKPAYQQNVMREIHNMAKNELRGWDTMSTQDLKPYQEIKVMNLGSESNRQAFEQMQRDIKPPEGTPVKRPVPEGGKSYAKEKNERLLTPEEFAYSQLESNPIKDRAAGSYNRDAQDRYNALLNSWGWGREDGFVKTGDPEHMKPIIDLVTMRPPEMKKIIESIPEQKPRAYGSTEAGESSYDTALNSMGFKNTSREIERRYGSKFHDFFTNPVREGNHNYIVQKSQMEHQFKISMKAAQKEVGKIRHADAEQAGAHLIGRQYEGPEILENMGVKNVEYENLSPQAKWLVKYFDRELPKLLKGVNAARISVGLDPIESTKGYFTFLRQFSMAEDLGINPVFASNEAWRTAGAIEQHPKGYSFGSGKERRESLRPLELNAINVYRRYLSSALKTTHMTPVVGTLRKSLDGFGLMTRNPEAYEFLTQTLDYVGGAFKKQNKVVQSISNHLSKNLGVFYIAANVNSIFMQPSSYILNWTRVGTRHALGGIGDMFSSKMRKFAYDKSAVLMGRIYDISVEEMQKTFTGKIGNIKSKIAEKEMLPMKIVDMAAAEATWLAGYRMATKSLGLKGKEAYQYADKMVVRTQGSGSRIDLAPIQHTPAGKAFTLFNTFTINQFNFIADDVLRGKGMSTGQRRMMMARLIAGMALANTAYEIAGYFMPWGITNTPFPAPMSEFYKALNGQSWIEKAMGQEPKDEPKNVGQAALAAGREMAGFLPVVGGSFKYGGKSVFGATGGLLIDTAQALANDPPASLLNRGESSINPIIKVAAQWAGVPGGSQMFKALKYYLERRKARTGDFESSMREFRKKVGSSSSSFDESMKEFRKKLK